MWVWKIVRKENLIMTTTAMITVTKMMESLPEPTQNQVVEYLREYIADIKDEIQWDMTFQKSQKQLVEAAQQAKREIAAGLAQPMDYNRL